MSISLYCIPEPVHPVWDAFYYYSSKEGNLPVISHPAFEHVPELATLSFTLVEDEHTSRLSYLLKEFEQYAGSFLQSAPPEPIWNQDLEAKVVAWARLYCTGYHEMMPTLRSLEEEVNIQFIERFVASGRMELVGYSRGLAIAPPPTTAEQQDMAKLALLRRMDGFFRIAHRELLLLSYLKYWQLTYQFIRDMGKLSPCLSELEDRSGSRDCPVSTPLVRPDLRYSIRSIVVGTRGLSVSRDKTLDRSLSVC